MKQAKEKKVFKWHHQNHPTVTPWVKMVYTDEYNIVNWTKWPAANKYTKKNLIETGRPGMHIENNIIEASSAHSPLTFLHSHPCSCPSSCPTSVFEQFNNGIITLLYLVEETFRLDGECVWTSVIQTCQRITKKLGSGLWQCHSNTWNGK